MITTAFCRRLGIEHPILSVGFGTGAGPALASAVSNAGGCGVLGLTAMPPELVRSWIRETRELTEKPFGGNVIIAGLAHHDVAPAVEERVAAAIEERVPVLVLFWGDPSRFVQDARRSGTTLVLQVGSVEEARAAAEAGVDAIIAQGGEAGGHVKSRMPIWEILPACVEAVAPIPVLASGGIRDGADVARAIALGAQAVSLGTRLVASVEAHVHDEYKRRIVAARPEDTVYTEDLFDVGWPGAPHRALRGRTFDEWDAAGRPPSGERPGEGTMIGTIVEPWRVREVPRYSSLMTTPEFVGDLDYVPMWAGESVGAVRDVRPAAEIVRELVAEALAATAAAAPPGR